MPIGSILGGIAQIGGGIAGSGAANAAGKDETGALRQANSFLTTNNATNQGYVSPYNQTGQSANSLLAMMMSNPQQFQNQFQASPGYQYNLQQQQGAINNSAAAKGGLGGGNTLMALQNNASGLANQDYQNYISNLMGLQQTGLSAGNTQAQLGQNYGQSYANNLVNIGNAEAGAKVASTQALWGGITSGVQGIGSGVSSLAGIV